ncbi:UDP-N-acetylmuramoyl-L-alanine--D-glutamate ligase [Shewanella submarina]|uniref:UDP-N-acetylmuramoylalanine--D-glutamate ligase n=1 Tax=Shewanella submarina TaxID=2016376 RepID=A0ABV7GPJ1_9GAMM|nr:UDP-N-acetylmuramoyl-L-alanine--D-glutamate ligase [Shewanella submarina]MCL1039673.1 UDP-N-acetylmuramoyl-L-alanine--D-glutamate ligase [Shewanella submarina]
MSSADVAMTGTAPTHIVLGLGATGLSVVRYLCARGIVPMVMDSRDNPPGAADLAREFPDVVLGSGGFDCRYLVQAQQIIISPGIALSTPEVRAALDMGIEVIGDIELFARDLKDQSPKTIGITGSNGKSTVTTLVGLMAEADGRSVGVGGNIGTPALDLLGKGHELYVLELSSFQLETTQSLNCVAATCLNISEDHMDRYTDLVSYRFAKMGLYRQSHLDLYNREDELTLPLEPGNRESFGLDNPQGDDWGIRDGMLVHGTSEIMPVGDVALIGRHNVANVLAAMALAYAAGISKAAMVKVAASFTGLSHRCERVARRNSVTWVNDSKATNVGATAAALAGLEDYPGKVILIAGGDGKGADFSSLQPLLEKVATVITLGRDGHRIAALKEGAIEVQDMAQAVTRAAQLAEAGDIVLLSPACASLDMYPHFMARGDDFRAQVEALDGQ